MRIFLAEGTNDVGRGALPIDADAPTVIPDDLRPHLQGALTLNGAAFTAKDLEKALTVWAISREDPRECRDEGDPWEVLVLPLVLMLGRDLVLVGRAGNVVNIQ